jgi:hypothetical protein
MIASFTLGPGRASWEALRVPGSSGTPSAAASGDWLADDTIVLGSTDNMLATIDLTLNNGVEMPALGFGVFKTPPDGTAGAVHTPPWRSSGG